MAGRETCRTPSLAAYHPQDTVTRAPWSATSQPTSPRATVVTLGSIRVHHAVLVKIFVRTPDFTTNALDRTAGDPNVPFARSLVDYISRKLRVQFVPGYREEVSGGGDCSEVATPVDEVAVQTVDLIRRCLTASQGGPQEAAVRAAVFSRDAYLREPAERITQASLFTEPVGVVQSLQIAEHVGAEHGRPCDTCGSLTVRSCACYRCLNCGSQRGCG
jgi:hypothetical protein